MGEGMEAVLEAKMFRRKMGMLSETRVSIGVA